MSNSKHFKELEIILSSFSCDKGCPYCTAKITNWESVYDDIHTLALNIGQLRELGYTFRYVTLGGNGEPTLHNLMKLKEIVELFDDYEGIEIKRVLTSGNVFRWEEQGKYKLFKEHGWLFEVTTTNFDFSLDGDTQNYRFNYFQTEAFRNAPVRLNYVLLENNIDIMISDLKNFIKAYPNIQTAAVKLLNVNTKTGLVDNKYSKWIVEHAIPKTDRLRVKQLLDDNFKYVGESFDTFSWLDEETGKEIYFSWKKSEYGLYDIVYYGNRFVNYQLEDVHDKVPLFPKVYIAARFNKKSTDKNKLDLSDDFRTKLIGDEGKFRDYNTQTFIKGENSEYRYQYIGPFYNEKASTGDLTSTICEEVVKTESNIIDRCDVFMAYLDDKLSPGGIAELIYAAVRKKKIVVFYKVNKDIEYELQTENWYPIVQARQLVGRHKVKIYPVHSEEEVMDLIKAGIDI